MLSNRDLECVSGGEFVVSRVFGLCRLLCLPAILVMPADARGDQDRRRPVVHGVNLFEARDFIRHAARGAALAIRSGQRRRHLGVESKGPPGDFVTKYDRMSEGQIAKAIAGKYPDHGIIGEEGTSRNPKARAQWHIDGLDGTTNFSRRLPIFAISAALAFDNDPKVGVIIAPSFQGGLEWSAIRGVGAWRAEHYRDGIWHGKTPIHVSSCNNARKAFIGTEITSDRESMEQFPLMHQAFGLQLRGFGSMALDLALVADGRLDAHWQRGFSSWDAAAGVLLVEEARRGKGKAGGRVTNSDDGKFSLDGRDILATNGRPRLHRSLVDVLQGRGLDRAKP